jgi:hypothetical protein
MYGLYNGMDGSAGSEDVVDDQPVFWGAFGQGGYAGRVDGIETLQLFFSPGFAKGFDGPGRMGFPEEMGMVVMMEPGCQLSAQDVEGGGGVGDGGFVMMQGPDEGSAGRDRHCRKHFQGAVDPSIEVGLPGAFEFEEAV